MDPISFYSTNSAMTTGTSTTETTQPEETRRNGERVSQATYDEYISYMKEIEAILAKSPNFTEEDCDKLSAALNHLKSMQDNPNEPLTADMNNIIDGLIGMLASGHIALTEQQFNLTFTPDGLAEILDLKVKDHDMTIGAICTSFVQSAINDTDETQSLADATLSLALEAYEIYENQLGGLEEKITISDDTIGALEDLEQILSQITISTPPGYTFNPTSWNQIPPELQELLKKNGITDIEGVNKNKDKYVDLSCEYFSQVIGGEAFTGSIEESLTKILSSRWTLEHQLSLLQAAGVSPDDPAYKTIVGVVDCIEAIFPVEYYPPLPPGVTVQVEGNSVFFYNPDGTAFRTPASVAHVTRDVLKFIESGEKKDTGISSAIRQAVTAHQDLSSTMTDEIKALNTWFQQLFDMLTAMQDAINKITTSSGHKIAS